MTNLRIPGPTPVPADVLQAGAAPMIDHRGRVFGDKPLCVSPEARRNRRMIRDLFAEQGFTPYPYEFWHYSHGDADYQVVSNTGGPARYGPVTRCARTGRLTAVPDIRTAFVSVDDIRTILRTLGGTTGARA